MTHNVLLIELSRVLSEKTSDLKVSFIWIGLRYVFWIIVGLTVGLTLGVLIVGLFRLLHLAIGGTATDQVFATLVSGTSSVLLVSVTVAYVYFTQNLVQETRAARIEERKRDRIEQKMEEMLVQRALLYEVNTAADLEYEQQLLTGSKLRPVPTTVYEQNAGRIARLREDEAKDVIEYYNYSYTINQTFESNEELSQSQIERFDSFKVGAENSLDDGIKEAKSELENLQEEYDELNTRTG